MAYQRKDSFYRKAKREGYRSRAAYKLIELDERVRLFRRGMRVLDLGCAPGGWLQVAAERVGPQGRVVGIDRLKVDALGLAQVNILPGDVTAADTAERLRAALGGPAQLVLSDMAPDTSGVAFADHVHSVELVQTAAALAGQIMAAKGVFLAKVFEGGDLPALVEELRLSVGKVRRLHLRSTRKGSRELYLLIQMTGQQK